MARKCGTVSGYQGHLRHGEEPDADCRKAWSTYQSEYRKKNDSPETRRKGQVKQAARSRALWRLRLEYPQRFHELYKEELAK